MEPTHIDLDLTQISLKLVNMGRIKLDFCKLRFSNELSTTGIILNVYNRPTEHHFKQAELSLSSVCYHCAFPSLI